MSGNKTAIIATCTKKETFVNEADYTARSL